MIWLIECDVLKHSKSLISLPLTFASLFVALLHGCWLAGHVLRTDPLRFPLANFKIKSQFAKLVVVITLSLVSLWLLVESAALVVRLSSCDLPIHKSWAAPGISLYATALSLQNCYRFTRELIWPGTYDEA